MHKQADTKVVGGTGPGFSYARTLNPWSAWAGGGDRYPEFWASMFPNNPNMAMTTFKMGAVGLLAAATVGGLRYLRHNRTMSELYEENSPAKKLRAQLSTTFEPYLSRSEADAAKLRGQTGETDPEGVQKAIDRGRGGILEGLFKKSATTGPAPAYQVALSSTTAMDNVMAMAWPLGAALLGSAVAYKAVDTAAEAQRRSVITDATREKADALRMLMHIRARVPRARASSKEMADIQGGADSSLAYNQSAMALDKSARTGDRVPTGTGYTRQAITAAGLLYSALGVATGVTAYNYFSKNNEGNIRYNAIKKGLNIYARDEALRSPISIIPQDADKYFKELDAPEVHKVTARKAPTVDPDALNNPISVLL